MERERESKDQCSRRIKSRDQLINNKNNNYIKEVATFSLTGLCAVVQYNTHAHITHTYTLKRQPQ